MILDQTSSLDRLAFSQMILAALSHDFVTPFRTAILCCRQIREFAEKSSHYNGADLAQIDQTRTAISKTLFPKLTGLHDEARRFHGGDPAEMVQFVVERVDAEIAKRLSDLEHILALADSRNPHGVLSPTLDEMETAIRKIDSMMKGIKATIRPAEDDDDFISVVSLDKAIARVDEVLRPLEPDLEIRTYGEVGVEANPWRIWSIFSNLIGNSVKYAKPGTNPRVDVRIGRPLSLYKLAHSFQNRLEKDRVSDKHYFVFLRALRERSDWCEVQVTDYGVGIPVRRQWGVFKLFKQLNPEPGYDLHSIDAVHAKMLKAYEGLESTSPRTHMGIGMGLALTQYYVRSLGGEIALSSKVGGPTTFGLWFPLTPHSFVDSAEMRSDVWWRG